jgi:hypothetical protein
MGVRQEASIVVDLDTLGKASGIISSATRESTDRAQRGIQYVHSNLDKILGDKGLESKSGRQRPALLFCIWQKKWKADLQEYWAKR